MRHVCIFRVADLHMCLPISEVQQVFETSSIHPVPLAPPAVQGLVNLRGLVVTALDMRVILGLPTDSPPPHNNLVAVREGQAVSLLVDEVLGVVEVLDDDIRPPPANLKPTLRALTNGVVLRDDVLVLLVDADHLATSVAA